MAAETLCTRCTSWSWTTGLRISPRRKPGETVERRWLVETGPNATRDEGGCVAQGGGGTLRSSAGRTLQEDASARQPALNQGTERCFAFCRHRPFL